VKEGLFLDGIALNSTHVSPGNIKFSTLVEANFADACLAFCDWTTVTAGKTAEAIALNGFVQFAFADVLIKNFAEG
jgi:hypothetical protein